MAKNPLKNYEEFSEAFDLLKMRFEYHANIINDETIEYVQFISLTSRWMDIGFKALDEVKKLILKNDSNPAYNQIISDYEKFNTWIENIEKSNPEIIEAIKIFEERDNKTPKTGKLNGTIILNYQQKPESRESKIILSYAKIINSFKSFYEPILGVCNHKIIRPNFGISTSDKTLISFDKEINKLNFQMGFTPENIWKYYEERNKFIYLSTETAINIPVLKVVNEGQKSIYKMNTKLPSAFIKSFDSYAKGFLKGFEINFTPFISTPENQKELILKSINNNNIRKGFPISYKPIADLKLNTESAYYDENIFFKMGEMIGNNYKAWTILLETPKYFENDLPFTIEYKKTLPKPPYKTFKNLYDAALHLEIIKTPHPAFIDNDLLYHDINFDQWLKDNKGLEKENKELYISLLTIENFEKHLQSNIEGKFYLKSKALLTDTKINIEDSIMNVENHIDWLDKQKDGIESVEDKNTFLNFQLDQTILYIDKALKFLSEYPSKAISIKIKDKISVARKYKNEIENRINKDSVQKLKQKSINKTSKRKSDFSLKEIAIAYCVMSITISSENADKILKKHSKFKSTSKLLQKRVTRISELTVLTENKTTDSKHLKSLENAKRLINGMKNKEAIIDIDRTIATFSTAYTRFY